MAEYKKTRIITKEIQNSLKNIVQSKQIQKLLAPTKGLNGILKI